MRKIQQLLAMILVSITLPAYGQDLPEPPKLQPTPTALEKVRDQLKKLKANHGIHQGVLEANEQAVTEVMSSLTKRYGALVSKGRLDADQIIIAQAYWEELCRSLAEATGSRGEHGQLVRHAGVDEKFGQEYEKHTLAWRAENSYLRAVTHWKAASILCDICSTSFKKTLKLARSFDKFLAGFEV